MSKTTIVQISDPHLLGDRAAALHDGVSPFARLAQAVERIPRAGVDLVLFTGDLVSHDPRAYPLFQEAIAPLASAVAFLPGNHDLRAPFRGHLVTGPLPSEQGLYRTVSAGHARLLLLDSLWDGRVEGRLGEEQLRWLDGELSATQPGPTLVFVHHPPMPTGLSWLDEHVIADGERFLDILASHGVGHVFFGHTHMPLTLARGGVFAVAAPSVAFGVVPTPGGPTLAAERCGFTWIEIEGSDVRSRVEWLPASAGGSDG